MLDVLTVDLIAIALKPLNCVPIKYQDINRVIAIRESGGRRYPSSRDPQGSFDAPARGKTTLASLNEDAPRIRWVMIWRRNPLVMLQNGLSRELNVNHLWRIHRIGSKESLASVVSASKRGIRVLNTSEGSTTFSFPLTVLSRYELRGRWVVESYVNPFKHFKKGESPALRYLRGCVSPFALPLRSSLKDTPTALVSASDKGVLLEVEGEGVIVGVRK